MYLPYEATILAFVRVSGERTDAHRVIKPTFIEGIIMNPHSLKV